MSQHSDVLSTTDGVFTAALAADDFLGILDREGRLLLQAADAASLSDEVAFCPGWTQRDLVIHLGWVYRWVSVIVGEGRPEPTGKEEGIALGDPDPSDGPGTLTRLASARALCLATLRQAPADLQCWTTWSTASTPRDFWIRRMVHETLIHRFDAQNAGGRAKAHGAEIPNDLATDGIDEMMLGFAGRYSKRLRHEQAATLAVTATDTGHRWWARISTEAPEFGRGVAPTPVDTEILAPSGPLLLWLWNRALPDDLEIRGESHLPATWTREAHL
jgi:uncharacterized protein (TIGR03083 family)